MFVIVRIDNFTPADVYFGRAELILAETSTHQTPGDREPSLAAPAASRLNSKP
jgi:hypothetical protein